MIATGALVAPVHAAPGDDPYAGGRSYVKTLRCPVADPWPGPPLQTWVDVWNRITYPSDGLPPPAIAGELEDQAVVVEPAELGIGGRRRPGGDGGQAGDRNRYVDPHRPVDRHRGGLTAGEQQDQQPSHRMLARTSAVATAQSSADAPGA